MRNLIVLQHVSGAAQLGLIDAPEDEIARQVEQSALFGASELARASDVVSEGLSGLKGATAPRLHLELMAAKLLLPATDSDERGTRARLDQLERRIASGEFHQSAHPGDVAIAAPAATAPAAAAPAIPVPPVAPAVSTPAATGESAPESPSRPKRLSDVAPSTKKESTASRPPMKPAEKAAAVESEAASAEPVIAPTNQNASLPQLVSMWPAILDATKSYSRVAWMVFSDSAPLSLENGVLAVGVENASKAANAKASGHDERLRQAVLDVFRTDVRIDIVLAPNATARLVNAPTVGDASDSGSDQSSATVEVVVEPDAPSIDDEDLDDTSGVDLIMRELGGTQIGEIEH
jgi:DNA polymerase-3 subunit gamma/tau